MLSKEEREKLRKRLSEFEGGVRKILADLLETCDELEHNHRYFFMRFRQTLTELEELQAQEPEGPDEDEEEAQG